VWKITKSPFLDVVTLENLFSDLGFSDVTYIDDYASPDGIHSWQSSLVSYTSRWVPMRP
jgi:hypothetical protein